VLTTMIVAVAGMAAANMYDDEVVLWDGNTIRGEMKKLQQGRLEFKVDKAGTLSIEWDRVQHLRSSKFFEIENRLGHFFYGSLGASSEPRQLILTGIEFPAILDLDDVVKIQPIASRFWDRIDGWLSFGFSFTSAQSIFQFNVEGRATYRQEKYRSGIRFSSFQTRQEDQEDVIRDNFEYDYTRYHKRRMYSTGSLSWSRSSELGLDSRLQIGYWFGQTLFQSNRSQARASLGLAVARDHPSGQEPESWGYWAAIGGAYQFFLYAYPKTEITVDLMVYPGLTGWPRWRADLNCAIRREIFRDVTINFTVFDSYDSRPPMEAVSNHDFGTVLGIGWYP
jgi:hypothetical protein